jgi:hypothetical protein
MDVDDDPALAVNLEPDRLDVGVDQPELPRPVRPHREVAALPSTHRPFGQSTSGFISANAPSMSRGVERLVGPAEKR